MISGAFGWSGVARHPFVRLPVRVPSIADGWAAVDFLVDTGASVTCLHPKDLVERFRVSQADLERVATSASLLPLTTAGGVVQVLEVEAMIAFLHDDGRAEQLGTSLRVALPTRENRALPSVLGMDILQHYRLTVTGLQSVALESLSELAGTSS